MNDFEVKLRIKDAYKEDAGRGIVRIDPDIFKELNLRTGDVVEIYHSISNKKTAGLLYPARKEDQGTKIIRMDTSLRRNVDASLEDLVDIRKIEAVPADKVKFAGLQEVTILRNRQQLARTLENRVITKNDTLSFYSYGRRIDLVVINFVPKSDAVRIHIDTKIILSDKSFKDIQDLERTKVSYKDIGGLEDEIQKVKEFIEFPLKNLKIFKASGISHPNGVLFYGPPGTGKTLMANALASETEVHCIKTSVYKIINKYYGENEEYLRKIFDEAKENAPYIIILDNLDLIVPKRRETSGDFERWVVEQLLSLMDDLKGIYGVIVIGITNKIDNIEPALRRAGRFDTEVEFKIPDIHARLKILKVHSRNLILNEDVNLELIAEKTDGFTGADIEVLIRNAAISAIKENLLRIDKEKLDSLDVSKNIEIKMDNLLTALENILS